MQQGVIELPMIFSQFGEGGRTHHLELNIIERLGGLGERVVEDQAARSDAFAGSEQAVNHLMAIDAHQSAFR